MNKNLLSLILTLALSFAVMFTYLFFFGAGGLRQKASDIISHKFDVEIDFPVPDLAHKNPEPEKVEPIKIGFVGDMMFDRYIRFKANQNDSYSKVLEGMNETLSQFDLVIANLEGPITTNPTKTNSEEFIDQLTFTFEPEVAKEIFNSNIKIVSLDNNHILNFGRDGLGQTLNYLNSNNIEYFGNPDKREVLLKEIKGVKLAFVSYNEFLPDAEKTLSLIREAETLSDWTIVYSHWGEEYVHTPNKGQIELAHSFVDAGADIVIGAHPHVLQKKEMYRDKWIYYSLGNFVFDQYFQEDVRCGAIVSFTIDDKDIKSIEEKFSYLDISGRTIPSDCAKEVEVLQL